MRSAIGFVATVATVFHLAFGCCLHAPHLGGPACCGTGAMPDCHAADCCDEHDHATPAEHAAHDADAGQCGAECGCVDCSCAATVANKATFPDLARPAAVAWGNASAVAFVGCLAAAAADSPADHRCPIPAAAGSPLFERLLV